MLVPNLPTVDNATKKRCLESAIHYLMDLQPFYGTMLQCMNISYSTLIPTACIYYNDKEDFYEILLNDHFFCGLELEQRIAVLHHEILHFTNKHLFRLPFINAKEEDRQMYNVAGDMAINQFIQDLPKGCIDVKEWKDDKGNPFPLFRGMEEYYDLIKNNPKQYQKKRGEGKGDTLDDHGMWEKLSEADKKKMLDEAKKLIQRTVEKTVFGGSLVPDSVKDLLQEIDTLAKGINYKQILRNAIKRTVSVAERESTWKKPSKRFNNYAPGSRLGSLPLLSVFIDTSGSISHTEMNDFLGVMNSFLKAGSRRCKLSLWHTDVYHSKNYKLNQKIKKDEIQSGGTDIRCVMDNIVKNNPNLAVVLTDMYFDMPKKLPKGTEIIFIVSKGGNKSLPVPKGYKVIYLDNLK